MFSFIALSSNSADGTAQADRLAELLQQEGMPWREVLHAPGLRVFCKGLRAGSNDVYRLHGDAGVVLGTLFERHADPLEEGPAKLARFDEARSRQVIDTRGRLLIDAYWGRYVAFLRDRNTPAQWVIRDPTGNLPCYRSCYEGVSIFYSQMRDLQCLPLKGWRIDENALRVRVAMGILHSGSTLENADHLYNGECFELYGSGPLRRFYWNPLRVAEKDLVCDPDLALRLLRAATTSAVYSWASLHSSIVILTSGGLDSSIVAGLLKEAPSAPRLSCFTIFMPADHNNTLPFSRTMARHLNVQPVEYPYDPKVRWSAFLGFPLAPSPIGDLHALGLGRAHKTLALETGATAIFTGDGGDSRFGATAARFSAREFVRRHGLRPSLLKVAEDVALLRGLTVWQVLGDALRARLRGDPVEHTREIRQRVLVKPEVQDSLCARTDYSPHPWYSELPPGQRFSSVYARLGTLTQIPPLYDWCADADGADPEYVMPLFAQPLVELNLRTPAWFHIAGGGDRVLARRAFTGRVPDAILSRHWKDRPDGFLEKMVQENLSWTRDLLQDGVLMKLNLLEPPALERHLNPRTIGSGMLGSELLDCVWVEGWGRRVLAS
jgi:asparagine synthase (glutamine-hydrolysing)